MQNAILIFFKNEPFITMLVHKTEFLSIGELLDKYSEFTDIDRDLLTGMWIDAIDITSLNSHYAEKVYAKNEWAQPEGIAESPP